MTGTTLNFGPNHAAVAEFIASARAFCPYRNVGEPTDADTSLLRVTFEFLAEHHSSPEAPWEGNLAKAEQAIQDYLRQGERWPIEDSIQRAVFHPDPPPRPDPHLDDLLMSLDETHGSQDDGYYPGTCLYPHEFSSVPRWRSPCAT